MLSRNAPFSRFFYRTEEAYMVALTESSCGLESEGPIAR